MNLSSLVRFTPVIAVGAVLLTGCSGSPEGVDPESAATPEGFGHIHALDVNPADGRLHVATHNGLFAQEGDSFKRVGKGRQDAMSFTIAGPDRFLMSGHPEVGSKAPVHLGLAESTDGGRSWTSLSLAGEADFHALENLGDRVYGVDSQSGRLMSTADGKRWSNLGQVSAVDVAPDPATPNRLLLTDGDGALFEFDESKSPQRVASAPSLVLLDWDTEDQVVGVGPQGAVHRSDDGGRSWQEAGSLPGAPQALTVTESRWYAATEDGVLVSKDGGKTWSGVGSS